MKICWCTSTTEQSGLFPANITGLHLAACMSFGSYFHDDRSTQ